MKTNCLKTEEQAQWVKAYTSLSDSLSFTPKTLWRREPGYPLTAHAYTHTHSLTTSGYMVQGRVQ